jgi:hypothetical protein
VFRDFFRELGAQRRARILAKAILRAKEFKNISNKENRNRQLFG